MMKAPVLQRMHARASTLHDHRGLTAAELGSRVAIRKQVHLGAPPRTMMLYLFRRAFLFMPTHNCDHDRSNVRPCSAKEANCCEGHNRAFRITRRCCTDRPAGAVGWIG